MMKDTTGLLQTKPRSEKGRVLQGATERTQCMLLRMEGGKEGPSVKIGKGSNATEV